MELSTRHFEPDWEIVVGGVIGGLSLFLLGMKKMGDALKQSAGERVKDVMEMLSSSKLMGIMTGLIFTALTQSSTTISVMMVGFVATGLMSFTQTLGILLGSGVGTTVATQIVSFHVGKFRCSFDYSQGLTFTSPYAIAVGFCLYHYSKSSNVQQSGSGLLGLGLIFFGIDMMTNSMSPLKTYEPFITLLTSVSNPLLLVFIAILFTATIQSSSACVSVVIALSSSQLLSLESGVCLVLGANIGTALTPCIAAIGASREAIRVAFAGLFFKIAGVILVFIVFSPFLALLERTSDVVSRQIANAHSLFNIIVCITFAPFTEQTASLMVRLIPDAPSSESTADVEHCNNSQS